MDAITLSPASTALLVVDIQDKLLAAMPVHGARRLLACAELLLEAARLFHMPVIVTEHYPQGLGATAPPLLALLQGSTPAPVVVQKTIFSAMGPPEVPLALETSGVRSVIVVGLEAHVCLFQTARELARRGYHTHVPFDAVASRDPGCKSAALALLGAHGVAVSTTETVIFDLMIDAKCPYFKALSKLIKALPMG